MSLSVQDHIRVQLQSRTGSVNGEDAKSSDVEPSEARSLGGRESALNLLKQALTLEQLEAAYKEARSRIFMDFEAKSRTGSVNGEDAESSDVEPSETGSLGGREGVPNRLKQTLTLEQREAAYNEARSRILMDFEARERRNEMSASSSTFSFISGSASVPMTLIHAQSSTSSTSRTTSTQHPLPPRPDWAIGLRPNPTLHPTRPSVHNVGPRNHTTGAPVLLQPADFPPLDWGAPSGSGGVWASMSPTSSSRTTSTQYPLLPRPDWAESLKPKPILHPMQPSARNGGPPTTGAPPVLLQPADFPPLDWGAPSRSDGIWDSMRTQSPTSSSSRTTSTQYPLLPRPDWAEGLKPNPTPHPTQPSARLVVQDLRTA
jgi:hypothetical protein